MTRQLSREDQALVEEARRIIGDRFKAGRHHVAAALRTRSGRVFGAVHLEATVGRIAVCAEPVAIGMAATAGDTEIDSIVAVDREGNVISPCGMCRELISDYAPHACVIVPVDGGESSVSVASLLPNKYVKRHGSRGFRAKTQRTPRDENEGSAPSS